MAITSTVARNQYTEGSVGPIYGELFSVSFYFIADADLTVVKTTLATGSDSTLVLSSDYIVANAGTNPPTGTVQILGGLVQGDIITIYRSGNYVQPAVYASNDKFPAKTTETALDRIVAEVQSLNLKVERSMRVPVTSGAQSEFPLGSRKNKTTGFDNNGDVQLTNPVQAIVQSGSVISFNSYSAARALSSTGLIVGKPVTITGYSSANDGGEGIFTFTSINPGADNNGTILALVDGLGWLVRNYSGTINVRWFGAKGDNTTDDTTAIQKTLTACYTLGGGTIYLPVGIYKTTSAIQVQSKVSIQGDGGEVSVLSPLSCDGLNFVSGNYDGGAVLFRDFGIFGRSGSTANHTAIQSILPSGGTHSVDSRDGLNFQNIKISEFNVGFDLTDLRESTFRGCKINKVNNPFSLGTYVISCVLDHNFLTYEGGCSYGGAGDKTGIKLIGTATEGIRILTNQIFGYERDADFADATWVVFDNNDCFATINCVRVSTVNSGLFIRGNYFEVGVANSIAILAVGLGSESYSLNIVDGNNFISDSANSGVGGIQLNSGATTNNFNWKITNNEFAEFTASDVAIYNGGNVEVSFNRFRSTTPTNNIYTTSIRTNLPIYVHHNRLAKAVAYDGADYTAGKIIIGNNVISGVQSFGSVFTSNAQVTGGAIDNTTIGATTPSSVTGSLFSTDIEGGYTAIGNTLVFTTPVATDGLWQLSFYGIQDTNVSKGPGMYLIQTRGTSATVTTVLAYTGMTVTVDGANKINIANGTAFNVIIQANLIRLR